MYYAVGAYSSKYKNITFKVLCNLKTIYLFFRGEAILFLKFELFLTTGLPVKVYYIYLKL